MKELAESFDFDGVISTRPVNFQVRSTAGFLFMGNAIYRQPILPSLEKTIEDYRFP